MTKGFIFCDKRFLLMFVTSFRLEFNLVSDVCTIYRALWSECDWKCHLVPPPFFELDISYRGPI